MMFALWLLYIYTYIQCRQFVSLVYNSAYISSIKGTKFHCKLRWKKLGYKSFCGYVLKKKKKLFSRPDDLLRRLKRGEKSRCVLLHVMV